MSKPYFLASLVLAACTSSTTTPAPRAPAPAPEPIAACVAGTPGTRVLFEITVTSKHPAVGEQPARFTLYTNGSWSNTYGARSTNGCLDLAQVAKLEAALAPATWQVTHQQLRCMAEAMSYTTVSFKGVVVHSHEMCDGQILDGESMKALQIANEIVRPLMAVPPA
jgi:hypothetical protein